MEILSNRQRQILETIVQEYILSVEPISSKLVDEKYTFGISPATIRNEMATLEHLGYLEHPHTSAGRIPTTKGYRSYVDSFLNKQHQNAVTELPEGCKAKGALKNIHVKETKEVLREAARLLSEITNYISVTLMPSEDNITIKHFNLLKVSQKVVLLIAVAISGDIFKEHIMLEHSLSNQVLQKIENVINKVFAEKNISTIKSEEIDSLQLGLPRGSDVIFNRLKNLFQVSEEDRLFIEGVKNLIFWPKHKVTDRELVIVFNDRMQIINFFNELESDQAITVRIGSEMSEISNDFSFVGASYHFGDSSQGMIGLIGPCYMQYPLAISTVKFFASNLSSTFGKII